MNTSTLIKLALLGGAAYLLYRYLSEQGYFDSQYPQYQLPASSASVLPASAGGVVSTTPNPNQQAVSSTLYLPPGVPTGNSSGASAATSVVSQTMPSAPPSPPVTEFVPSPEPGTAIIKSTGVTVPVFQPPDSCSRVTSAATASVCAVDLAKSKVDYQNRYGVTIAGLNWRPRWGQV